METLGVMEISVLPKDAQTIDTDERRFYLIGPAVIYCDNPCGALHVELRAPAEGTTGLATLADPDDYLPFCEASRATPQGMGTTIEAFVPQIGNRSIPRVCALKCHQMELTPLTAVILPLPDWNLPTRG